MPFTVGGGDYQNLEALIFSSRCSFQFVSDVTLFLSQRNCLKSYFPELFAINAGSCGDRYCGPLPEQERLLTFAFPRSWAFPQDSAVVNLKNILGDLEQKTQSLKDIRSFPHCCLFSCCVTSPCVCQTVLYLSGIPFPVKACKPWRMVPAPAVTIT